MSPRIDLTLVRMNCRSIGLPLGRLNEQAKHWGPVVGRLSLPSLPLAQERRRGTGGKDAMISRFPPPRPFCELSSDCVSLPKMI